MTKKLSELEDTLVALDASVTRKLDLMKDKELEIEEGQAIFKLNLCREF